MLENNGKINDSMNARIYQPIDTCTDMLRQNSLRKHSLQKAKYIHFRRKNKRQKEGIEGYTC